MVRAWGNIEFYVLICKELDEGRVFTTAKEALEALSEHRTLFPDRTWRVCKFALIDDDIELPK